LTDLAFMRIEIETPGQEAYETLNERLVDFNRTKVNWGTAAFTVVLRDEIGSVRGGAHGVVRMGAVEIRSVWLDGDLRGRGFGAKIIRAVEDEARRLGARAALLDSYEFQARGFYERLGYTSFGSFTYPDGVSRFYLSRAL
jgi:GNAT superfamily N-acetyltransferase